MAININMTKENYESFMKCIQVFFKKCPDVSIVNGKIYQFNSEGKRVLFDMDLSDIFGKNSIYLSGFEQKYSLLDIFKKQYSVVDLEITDKKYIFSDKYSSIEFSIPDPNNLIVKPSSEGSTVVSKFTSANYKNTIMKYTIDPFIQERIISAQKTLDTNTISIVCNAGEAQLVMTVGDNNNKSQMFKILETEASDDYNGVVIFPIDPFTLNSEGTEIYLYGHEDEDDLMILKTKTELGIDPVVPVNMYSTGVFVKKK